MSSTEVNECSVCLDTYTPSLRKKIVCESCNYAVCKSCICTYFMNTTKEFHCMNCNIAWSYEFMVHSVSRSYLNTKYTKVRSSYLFDVELSKIPETMSIIERMKEQEKLREDRNELVKLHNSIHSEINGCELLMHSIKYIKWLEQDIDTLISKRKEYDTANAQMETLRERARDINRQIDDIDRLLSHKKKTTKTNKFIVPCSKDDCKGFLNCKYVCSICDTKYCSKCHIEKTDEHECKQDDIETAVYIMKQTKPCPKCGTRISKIDGCDQMWCVHCHTTFSWKTGKAQLGGNIHNPHFVNFVRNGGVVKNGGGGEQAIHECNGDLPYQGALHNFIFRNLKENFNIDCSLELVRSYFDIEQKAQTNEALINKHRNHTDKRIEYIKGSIDRDTFRKYLNRCDRILQREIENQYIYDTLLTVMKETILGLYNSHSNYDDIVERDWNKICELIEYCDKEFERIGNVFGVIPCHIFIEMDGDYPRIVMQKRRREPTT